MSSEESQKELYSEVIGGEVSSRSSRPLQPEQAKRYLQIQQSGETSVRQLLSWETLPNKEGEAVKAVRNYYCQWTLDYSVMAQAYIIKNHKDFFDWLSCAQLTTVNGIIQ